MSTIIQEDFKQCEKFPFLTKEIVMDRIKEDVKEWKASDDYWNVETSPFLNACSGYDVNVIGDEYSKVGRDTFKVVVYALYFNEESEELETDENHIIFSFLIEGECTTYKFEDYKHAEEFMESMPAFTNWDEMTKEDLAEYYMQCDTQRDISYDYDCDAWDLECEMREIAYEISLRVLTDKTDTNGSIDVLVDLIKKELKDSAPSREVLHTLVKKYCSPCDNLESIIKSVECQISFKMEEGVLIA